MGQTGWTASADAAPKLPVCEHELSGDPAAGYSIHPAAPSNYQQPCQVLDGVQGAKHRALGLLKCSVLLPSEPRASEQPRPWSALPGRWRVPRSCRVLVGGGEINAQSGVSAAWLVHPPRHPGERVTFAAVPAWAACLASMERFCPVQRRGEAAASPAVSNGITQNEGHHRTESNCGVFENAHSSLHRAAAVHCKGDSFLAWFLRGGGFCLLICQLPPAIARFVSLPASLKHYKI